MIIYSFYSYGQYEYDPAWDNPPCDDCPPLHMSLLEVSGIFFLVFLSFVFHLLVYENDYVEKWYYKLIIAVAICVWGWGSIAGWTL